jgi:ketosteroid isomerase-like protein
MRPFPFFSVLPTTVLLTVLFSLPAKAQNQADLDAIHELLDHYNQLEEAMDMAGQASLMSEERVWIGPTGMGRRTDQAENMKLQQAQFDLMQKTIPGIIWMVDDRDLLVRFYAGGRAAIASFYRYSTYLIPPGTPPEVAAGLAALQPGAFTVVLEKTGGDWKIVHTHVSSLLPPAGS